MADDKEEPGPADPAAMTADELRQACEQRAKAEADQVAKAAGGNGHNPDPDYRFLKQCLDSNELGDGMLFARHFVGKFIFNASGQNWLRFNGCNWERDIEDQALGAVETVNGLYLRMLDMLAAKKKKAADEDRSERIKHLSKVEKKLFKRVSRLRTDRGRRNVLKFAAANSELPLVTREEEFDRQPWLLPVKNAVIDLRSGDTFDGRPDDMLLKCSPTEWRGVDHPAPTWERFMKEVFQGDEEMIGFMQRMLGYCLTGDVSEHVLPIFTGRGRNGKGTIFEIMHHILGELCEPVKSEMLLDTGQIRSSAAPSADIMSLKGLRIAYASENDENRRFSMSRVKWLSGADSLRGRTPNEKYEVTFQPTHKLFLGTNDVPTAISDDYAFWQRVKVVRFGLSFVPAEDVKAEFERPRDKDLPKKLEAESSGILAWLVRGCLEWQRIGLAAPDSVKSATEDQRARDDIYQDWIDECLVLDKYAETSSTKLYNNFALWYGQNVDRKRVPSQHRWGKQMVKRFKREKHGTYVYYGISCPDLPACPHCGAENFPTAKRCHNLKCQKDLSDDGLFA